VGSVSKGLCIVGILLVILAASVAVYWSDRQESNGSESPIVFEVYGFCSPTNTSALICVGNMVNQGASIIPINNVTIGIDEYYARVTLNPSMVLKEYSSVHFEFILDSNGMYTLYSSDGVSWMTWRGVIDPPPEIIVQPVLVFNETHRSIRSNGLIPIEINDYQFISNESGGYFGVLYFHSTTEVSFVDIKLMVLHDRLAWEDVLTNVVNYTSVIPFQTALYPAGEYVMIGYPSRVTVSYESMNNTNATVELEVYRTGSAVFSFDVGQNRFTDILPILPPHLSEILFNSSPYLLYNCPIPQTLNNPTR
jgi:hypothetical protein